MDSYSFEVREKLVEKLNEEVVFENSSELLIYGAGNTARLYENCFEKENIKPVYFIDKDKNKQGKKIINTSIISPEEIMERCKNPVVFICIGQYNLIEEVSTYLNQKNIKNYLIDTYVFTMHRDDILNIFDKLDDELSKITYGLMLLHRMGEKISIEQIYSKEYLFAVKQFNYIDRNENFVDCGAFVGDTIEHYINARLGNFSRIFAFEPEKKNFNAMVKRVNRLKEEWALDDSKIELFNLAVGNGNSNIMYLTNVEESAASLGASVTTEQSCNKIEICSLDKKLKGVKVGFIKADIEGSEEEMLYGAKNIIRESRPKLSVCIYHNARDMWQIPKQILCINPDYKLYVRQHQVDFSETVLYCC